jgi:hypothetical protein
MSDEQKTNIWEGNWSEILFIENIFVSKQMEGQF